MSAITDKKEQLAVVDTHVVRRESKCRGQPFGHAKAPFFTGGSQKVIAAAAMPIAATPIADMLSGEPKCRGQPRCNVQAAVGTGVSQGLICTSPSPGHGRKVESRNEQLRNLKMAHVTNVPQDAAEKAPDILRGGLKILNKPRGRTRIAVKTG